MKFYLHALSVFLSVQCVSKASQQSIPIGSEALAKSTQSVQVGTPLNMVNPNAEIIAELNKLPNPQKIHYLSRIDFDIAPRTALLNAGIELNNPEIIKKAIGFGANALQAPWWKDQSPLEKAISENKLKALRMLISAGADVNRLSTTHFGGNLTPLMQAINRENAKAIWMLLEAGANPLIQNPENNMNAYDYAREKPNMEEVFKTYKQVHTHAHCEALKGASQKAMEGQMKRMGQEEFSGVTEELSGEVSKYLR